MHVFLTGPRQIGKSTVIDKVIVDLPVASLGGFRSVSRPTELPRALAELYIVPAGESQPRFDRDNLAGIRWGQGQFTAFPMAFELTGTALLTTAEPQPRLLLMDELGAMEQQAPRFCAAVLEKLDGDIPILGVIKPKPGLLADAVRAHPSAKVVDVTEQNRNALPDLVRELLLY